MKNKSEITLSYVRKEPLKFVVACADTQLTAYAVYRHAAHVLYVYYSSRKLV